MEAVCALDSTTVLQIVDTVQVMPETACHHACTVTESPVSLGGCGAG